jgi:hypothetical protein
MTENEFVFRCTKVACKNKRPTKITLRVPDNNRLTLEDLGDDTQQLLVLCQYCSAKYRIEIPATWQESPPVLGGHGSKRWNGIPFIQVVLVEEGDADER